MRVGACPSVGLLVLRNTTTTITTALCSFFISLDPKPRISHLATAPSYEPTHQLGASDKPPGRLDASKVASLDHPRRLSGWINSRRHLSALSVLASFTSF